MEYLTELRLQGIKGEAISTSQAEEIVQWF